MSVSEPVLAIDFGTSNSAAAILEGGMLRRIAIEAGEETLPTAVFFDSDTGAMRIGAEAAEALIAGDEGRYMRALKSVLGTSLFPRKTAGRRQAPYPGRDRDGLPRGDEDPRRGGDGPDLHPRPVGPPGAFPQQRPRA